MPSVPVQIRASIQDGGWLTHVQSSLFSGVLECRGENDTKTGVDKNILLRFRRDENGFFWKRIRVDGVLGYKNKTSMQIRYRSVTCKSLKV